MWLKEAIAIDRGEVPSADWESPRYEDIGGFYASMRRDTRDVLGIVGERYRIVQNHEAFGVVDQLLGNDIHFEIAGSLHGGRRVWVRATLPEHVEIGGDAVRLYVLLMNCHDGSRAVIAATTPIRMVCQNTLNWGLRDARQKFSIRHTKALCGPQLERDGLPRRNTDYLYQPVVEMIPQGRVSGMVQLLALGRDEDAMGSAAEKTKWMRGTTAPLRGALLGLVLERPGHSYELANRLVKRLGETWQINVRDVYRLLKELEEWDLVSSSDEPRRGQRGTHPVYFPTGSTEDALALWMETLVPMAPVRVGLQAKLAVARGQDAPRLLTALRQYERECLDLLRVIPAAPEAAPSWKALFMDCTREGVAGQLRHEIAWAQHTRTRIREYAAVG